jgi:hypothetical protein
MIFKQFLQRSVAGGLYLVVTFYCLLRFREPPGHILILADVQSKKLQLHEYNIYKEVNIANTKWLRSLKLNMVTIVSLSRNRPLKMFQF